jgi:membrane-associated phospholipid phosphatase
LTGVTLYAVGVGIAVSSLGGVLLGAGSIAFLGLFYTYVRVDARFSTLGFGAAFLIVYTAVAASLSYAMTALSLPLQDAKFAAIDEAIGFDWSGYFAWTASNPAAVRILRAAYDSSLPQCLIFMLLFPALGQKDRIPRFLLLFVLTSFATIVISGLLPAVGAVVHHNPPEALRKLIGLDAGVWHLPDFESLRAGTFGNISIGKVEGLITFPSFHTALAVIAAWAYWSVRWMRWPAAAASALIVASTPSVGGHYLIDVIAGALIAGLAIAYVEMRWMPKRDTETARRVPVYQPA